MVLIEQTEVFVRWRQSLRDPVARAAIRRRMWRTVIFLLCGGNKATQEADIKTAKKLLKEL